jgi:hypothetical protein
LSNCKSQKPFELNEKDDNDEEPDEDMDVDEDEDKEDLVVECH